MSVTDEPHKPRYAIRVTFDIYDIELPDLDLSDFKSTRELEEHIACEAFKLFMEKSMVWPTPVGTIDVSDTVPRVLVDEVEELQRRYCNKNSLSDKSIG